MMSVSKPVLGMAWLGALLALSACAAAAPPAATVEPSRAAAAATATGVPTTTPLPMPTPTPPNPLSIEWMRQRKYPGSAITIEETLAPGSNYNRYIAAYRSDGFKIFALLTVPKDVKPKTGWPVIIFNHGYIPPDQYRTTERYVAYQDALARAGYITFKSDYRGNGNSEGTVTNPHLSPDYTIDVLNALASLKNYPDADPNRIGMWGHSLGGGITLRAMVVSPDIKAGVIWSGTVGTYDQPQYTARGGSGDGNAFPHAGSGGLGALTQQYGAPAQNPQFWASISPNTYVADLSGPLQLHHDLADSEVPFKYSQVLYDQVKQAGKTVELYAYPGDDHNLANSFDLAMQRTIAFFDQYVKGK